MKEIWKDVVGYEGLYKVSNKGNIKSVGRFVEYNKHHKHTKQFRKSKKLTQVIMKNNYLRVEMSKNNVHKLILVHRIVEQAFIPNQLNKKQVNHINGIKTDNRVENLEWATCKENMKHAWDHNLYKNNKPILQIKDGIIVAEYRSAYECRKLGYSPQGIGKVALGKRKSAYGFQWRFKEKEKGI